MADYNPNDPNPNNPAHVGNSRPKGPRAGVNAPGPRGPQQKNRQGEGQQVRLTGQTAEEIQRSVEQATETKLVNRGVNEKADEARKAWSSPNQNFAAAQAEAAAAMAAAEAMHNKDEIMLDGAASLMGDAITNRSKEAEETIYVNPVKPVTKADEFGISGGQKSVKTKGKPLTNDGPDVRPNKVLRPEEKLDIPNETIIGVDNHANDGADIQADAPVMTPDVSPIGEDIQGDGVVIAKQPVKQNDAEIGITVDDPGIYMNDESYNYDDAYNMLYGDDMMPSGSKKQEEIVVKEDVQNNNNGVRTVSSEAVNPAYKNMMDKIDDFYTSSNANDKSALSRMLSDVGKAYAANMNNFYRQQLYFNTPRMNTMQTLGYLAGTALVAQVAMGLQKGINKNTPNEAFETAKNGGKFIISSYDTIENYPNNPSEFGKYLQQHRDDIMIHVGDKLGISEEAMKKNNIYVTDTVSDYSRGRNKHCVIAYSGFDGMDAKRVDTAIREAVMDVCAEYGDPNLVFDKDTYKLSKHEKSYCEQTYSNIKPEAIRTYSEKMNSINKPTPEVTTPQNESKVTLDAGLSAAFDAAQERASLDNDGMGMG